MKKKTTVNKSDKEYQKEVAYYRGREKYLTNFRIATAHYELALADLEIAKSVLDKVPEKEGGFPEFAMSVVKIINDSIKFEVDMIRKYTGKKKGKQL